ncbi:MAG: hypothetical protein HY663_04015 [Chloroflexi bacterium]|nr:hypothetical protein [Chloroflexota bacterium]
MLWQVPMIKRWQRLLASVVMLILLLTLLSPVGLSPAVAVGSVTVSINVPGKVAKGAEFIATVNVSEVANFDSASYDISFNPTIVEVTSVTGGKIGETDIPVVLWNGTEPGIVKVLQNIPGVPGVSGSGYLARIHFRALSQGISNITLSNGVLADNQAHQLPADWLGASVEVSVAAPVVTPVTTPGVTPVIGGGLPPAVVVVSSGVIDVSRVVAANGVFNQDVTAASGNGKVKLGITQMTVGKTKTDAPLSTISISEMAEPPLPSVASRIVGLTYDLGPGGATFTPAVTLALTYDPAEIPEGVNEESLVIAMWDETAAQWLVLAGSTVNPVTSTVTVPVSHFTVFTIIAPAPENKEVALPEKKQEVPPEKGVVTSGKETMPPGKEVLAPGKEIVPSEEKKAIAKPINWGLIGGSIAGAIVGLLFIILLLIRKRREL